MQAKIVIYSCKCGKKSSTTRLSPLKSETDTIHKRFEMSGILEHCTIYYFLHCHFLVKVLKLIIFEMLKVATNISSLKFFTRNWQASEPS